MVCASRIKERRKPGKVTETDAEIPKGEKTCVSKVKYVLVKLENCLQNITSGANSVPSGCSLVSVNEDKK